MDRAFDRIFSQSVAAVESAKEQLDVDRQQTNKQQTQEDELRKMTTNMTASDAIKRIILASKDKDYFRMLQLPEPEADALGRVTWTTTPNEVSKAYRKLSILVHPDKNPGDEARQAFEALNEAHRALKDAGKLEGILKDHAEKARSRREEAEAKATLEERVILNARQKEEAKILKKKEGEDFQQEILRQMKEKQEKAKRKRQQTSRYTRRDDDDDDTLKPDSDSEDDADDDKDKKKTAAKGDGTDSEEEEREKRRKALAKRKQQRRPIGGI